MPLVASRACRINRWTSISKPAQNSAGALEKMRQLREQMEKVSLSRSSSRPSHRPIARHSMSAWLRSRRLARWWRGCRGQRVHETRRATDLVAPLAAQQTCDKGRRRTSVDDGTG